MVGSAMEILIKKKKIPVYFVTADHSPEFHFTYHRCWMKIHKNQCKNKPVERKARPEENAQISIHPASRTNT